jgi:DNA-binding transcriptional LysR family regulator
MVDLGFVAFPVRHPSLEIRVWRKDAMVLICPPQHPLLKQRSVRLRDLVGQKFIAFTPDIPTRLATDTLLKKQGVDISIVMELDNIETVKRAVEIGAGIAIVPRSTVLQEVDQQTLAEIELSDVEFIRPVAVIYKRNKVLSPVLKLFLAMLG